MKIVKRLLETIPHVILFGALFAFMGYVIPYSYYNFFDNTHYYKILSPVEVEQKKYHFCENINAFINRESLIDGHGNSIINLTLIREDESGKKEDRIGSVSREISIRKGTGVVITHWKLPCEVDDNLVATGKYYYDGVVEYEVRGIKKYESFTTEVFEIYVDKNDVK